MRKEVFNPTVERGFSLYNNSSRGLFIPPKKYARFLNKCVDTFTETVLGYHKSKTIEEAEEKYREKVKKLNPDKKDEELHLSRVSMIEVCMNAELEFLRDIKTGKKGENFYCKCSEFKKIIYKKGYPYGMPINPKNYEKDIEKHVSNFKDALDKKYPNRKDKMPCFDPTERVMKQKNPFPSEFELRLSLNSEPTSNLETDIILCRHGLASNNNGGWCSIPGIRIKTEMWYGSLDFLKKLTDKLEKIVNDNYTIHRGVGISHLTGYSEKLI